jgi:tRNA 2-thiouridine synthesizing protein A
METGRSVRFVGEDVREQLPLADQVLDVKGLDCPVPILRTKRALAAMAPGELIHVIATDPHSELDFRAYCARTGHELVAARKNGETFEFYVRRRG